jgi:5-methylcytosine-specific restriction endonuclease McrA
MPASGSTAVAASHPATSGVASTEMKVLEGILQKLIYKETFGTPKTYELGDKIKCHLEKVEDYIQACGIQDEESKIAILCNSLCDEARWELCGLLEFEAHKNDYSWMKARLLGLFESKETKITPLIKLFQCKQKPNQRTREYLSEIRRQGYLLMKGMDPVEREGHMTKAFTNGLRSKEIRKALAHVEVVTLDEAYDLVKREHSVGSEIIDKDDDDVRVRNVQDTASEMEKLQNQMTIIQKQLSYIVRILQSKETVTTRPTYADAVQRRPRPTFGNMEQRRRTDFYPSKRMEFVPPQPKPNYNAVPLDKPQRSGLQCWSCGEVGHIARFCARRSQCNRCGRYGHQAKDCFSSTRVVSAGRVRGLREMDSSERQWNETAAEESVSDSIYEAGTDDGEDTAHAVVHAISVHKDTQNEISEENAEIFAMTLHNNKSLRTTAARKHLQKEARPKYPDDVVAWAEFIDGRRKKRPDYGGRGTLISENNRERAANKPIITGTCQGQKTKIFCDTGAEVNVVDLKFVQELRGRDSLIKIRKTSKNIRCANDSSMNVVGWVRLNIKIGEYSKWCRVWVVSKLFPRIILGIRTLKDMGICVDPPNDCIRVQNDTIPFVSKVRPETVHSSEN